MNQVVLWIAQGFGSGRIHFAPGTFGSVAGLLWVAALLATRSAWWFAIGTLLGIAASVWLCGKAERILGETDPGSVVIDEIAAMPVCFAAWLSLFAPPGGLPPPQSLLAGAGPWWILGILLAFRVFDIAKPWPVRQSQALPGGWGVTIDDQLAALYVNLVVIIVAAASALLR